MFILWAAVTTKFKVVLKFRNNAHPTLATISIVLSLRQRSTIHAEFSRILPFSIGPFRFVLRRHAQISKSNFCYVFFQYFSQNYYYVSATVTRETGVNRKRFSSIRISVARRSTSCLAYSLPDGHLRFEKTRRLPCNCILQ